jgi:hypothetical protein
VTPKVTSSPDVVFFCRTGDTISMPSRWTFLSCLTIPFLCVATDQTAAPYERAGLTMQVHNQRVIAGVGPHVVPSPLCRNIKCFLAFAILFPM